MRPDPPRYITAPVIAVLPTNPDSIPADMHLLAAGIVSQDHKKIPCGRCHEECWIGAAQLRMVRVPGAEVVCYLCIARDPKLRQSALAEEHVTCLDPHADAKPRRSSSWLAR